ncbi:hypothetical protein Emtol_2905 [Emticicia oligotrophica DSM 17448]|uniref:TonB C-terminal domain-containing protein n=1 Tax=Emticicia oligotrophica (strain DSM 17448 / CIP 109782 / MTCC 6937 / GPTSA100-15) TaxID=929562 RepID=A0ABM5N3U9_EMTOG|nr:hypothetical protein [Emticicia oligotrophica]AFK04038.1 hypothetical protein Emtol_2905 [Emticicia oligotrophica DSM 17448]
MKATLASFLCIFITTQTYAQKDLDRNLVFFELAKKTIEYPKVATLSSIYGRIFTKFSVTKAGKIEGVEIFYPKMANHVEKSIGFEASIKRGLKKLPLLGLGYEGTYILPIAFVFENLSENPSMKYPDNQLPEFINTESMTVLTEIQIFSSSNRYAKPDFKGGFQPTIPSQQIVR